MKFRQSILFLLLAPACFAQIEVGSGVPSQAILFRWIAAYNRNGFLLLAPSATTAVVKFGPTGLNQEFADITNTGGTRYALVKANTDPSVAQDTLDVFQVYPIIYGTYKGSVNTYGYPAIDTAPCYSPGDLSCAYQLFDKNYVIFGYARATLNGQFFVTRDPYFTKWQSSGGILRMGAATNVETAAVSGSSSANAVMQSFNMGVVYNITSGLQSGKIYAVRDPVYTVYVRNGGQAGALGYPASEELLLPTGLRRQNFEGGAIDYDPATGSAYLRPGVRTVTIVNSTTGSVKLKVGDSYNLQARVVSTAGDELSDRTVNWISSNPKVIAVVAGGYAATLQAVGAGTATVTAVVEGRSSTGQQFSATGTCCAVGEGAPTSVMQVAFQNAVTRDRLNVQLPAPAPVQRTGGGYVQALQSAGTDNARYLLALSDRSPSAWVVTGPILESYYALGGPAGQLGYPTSDATAGGRQLFENGALAGSPVRAVTGPILAKWSTAGYETGALGSPAGDVFSFLTFTATMGLGQPFTGGNIYYIQTGLQAGGARVVAGLIQLKYDLLGGPAGKLGAPLTDEFVRDGRRRQEFEGGTVDYAAGEAEATVTLRPRKPAVDATPTVATAGSRVRIRISGFDDDSALRVSITGQPDFTVQTATGSYAWDILIPTNAASGTITVRALLASGGVEAQTSFSVRSAAESHLQVVIVGGDRQAVAPGAVFPQPLRVVARDSSGNPVAGVAVSFEASSGAQILSADASTGANGQAAATLRAPAAAGVVLITARIAGDVATFQAVASEATLANFPRLTQSGDTVIGVGGGTIANQGAMLTATAAIVRYYQLRGELATPLGLADPVALNQYLTAFCVADWDGNPLCDGYLVPAASSAERVVNLWRLSGFAGQNLAAAVAPPDLAVVRDALANGQPVLLALALTVNGAPLGSHYVVAVGVDADGAILIHDPSPVFARANLADYENGFEAGGRFYKGGLVSVVVLRPQAAAQPGFLAFSTRSPVLVTSAAGACGAPLQAPAAAAVPGDAVSPAPGTFSAFYCDGALPFYQLESSSRDPYQMTLTDLGSPASRAEISAGGEAAFKVVKSGLRWVVAAQDATFSPGSVVNGATFQPGVAPGGLMAIFGTGLARVGSDMTVVEVAGRQAVVVSAFPFQLNVQVPPATVPGPQPITVRSPYGSLTQAVPISAVAPGIFILSGRQGAVVNENGTVNSALNPLRRGQIFVIYCTGLGAVAAQGGFQVARSPVAVLLQGRALQPAFAGLTPRFVGLYQVNVQTPADLPPGLDVPLSLRQEQLESNPVDVSLQ